MLQRLQGGPQSQRQFLRLRDASSEGTYVTLLGGRKQKFGVEVVEVDGSVLCLQLDLVTARCTMKYDYE